jgi:hypothetical protein
MLDAKGKKEIDDLLARYGVGTVLSVIAMRLGGAVEVEPQPLPMVATAPQEIANVPIGGEQLMPAGTREDALGRVRQFDAFGRIAVDETALVPPTRRAADGEYLAEARRNQLYISRPGPELHLASLVPFAKLQLLAAETAVALRATGHVADAIEGLSTDDRLLEREVGAAIDALTDQERSDYYRKCHDRRNDKVRIVLDAVRRDANGWIGGRNPFLEFLLGLHASADGDYWLPVSFSDAAAPVGSPFVVDDGMRSWRDEAIRPSLVATERALTAAEAGCNQRPPLP